MTAKSSFDSRAALPADVAEVLDREHCHLIDGVSVASASSNRYAIFNPATGAEISSAANGDSADINAAVDAARRAFEHGPWSRMKPIERSVLLTRLGDLIEKSTPLLACLETVNNGAPIAFTQNFFVKFAANQFRYCAGWPMRLNGESMPVSSPGDWHAFTIREALGVVGIIVPWNAPLMLTAQKVAPALAAGCCVVLKPAAETPLTALLMAKLALEAGIPPGVFNVVTGGAQAGAELAAHAAIDKISFTGSTATGKKVLAAASGNLKKVALELGGKSPSIVFADADLELAAAGTASAIFRNAGQICVAGSRLYVDRRIFDQFVDRISAHAKQLRVGPGLDPSTQMGPLISEVQLKRVTAYIEAGRRDGADIITGGTALDGPGHFVSPTVMTKTTRDMSVVREEIFGPVLCMMPIDADDLDGIAKEANDTPYGLAASIWTRDLGTAHKLAKKLKAGSVGINSHGAQDVVMPFGGMKQSGWGRENGEEGVLSFTELKSVSALL